MQNAAHSVGVENLICNLLNRAAEGLVLFPLKVSFRSQRGSLGEAVQFPGLDANVSLSKTLNFLGVGVCAVCE